MNCNFFLTSLPPLSKKFQLFAFWQIFIIFINKSEFFSFIPAKISWKNLRFSKCEVCNCLSKKVSTFFLTNFWFLQHFCQISVFLAHDEFSASLFWISDFYLDFCNFFPEDFPTHPDKCQNCASTLQLFSWQISDFLLKNWNFPPLKLATFPPNNVLHFSWQISLFCLHFCNFFLEQFSFLIPDKFAASLWQISEFYLHFCNFFPSTSKNVLPEKLHIFPTKICHF